MSGEHRRIVALIVALFGVLALIVWQTTGQLRDSRDTRAYELTPPTAFDEGADPSIIDPAKLSAPLVPDQAYLELLETARADFALVGGLRVADRAALVERMGSAESADRVIGTLAPDADNLAGAAAKLLSAEVSEYSDTGAVVSLFASYTISGQAPAYRTFRFAYAPQDEGYRLDAVSQSTGAEPPSSGSSEE